MVVNESDLVEIGNKYLFMPDTDRCWKVPVLYNELRRLRGNSFQRFIHPAYELDIFEREIKLILDSIIPCDYIFTGEGGTWVWPYDEEDGEVDEEDGEVVEDGVSDVEVVEDVEDDAVSDVEDSEDGGMPFMEFMAVRGVAQ